MTKSKVRKIQSEKKAQAVTQGNDNPAKNRSSKQGSSRAEAIPALSGGVMGFVDKVKSFFLEVRVEFDKITWPTRKEAIALTTAVLAITFFFTAYLGIVDISLTKLVSFLIY
ncbi:MAG: preprotein translocase subunit SecE [Deltaproteobacteria bacterium]|nr:MAG: preprotein translocase subunit SecE [Deltaproteobacteria bacterium]